MTYTAVREAVCPSKIDVHVALRLLGKTSDLPNKKVYLLLVQHITVYKKLSIHYCICPESNPENEQ